MFHNFCDKPVLAVCERSDPSESIGMCPRTTGDMLGHVGHWGHRADVGATSVGIRRLSPPPARPRGEEEWSGANHSGSALRVVRSASVGFAPARLEVEQAAAMASGGPEVLHRRPPVSPDVPSGIGLHINRSRRVWAAPDRRKRFVTKKYYFWFIIKKQVYIHWI